LQKRLKGKGSSKNKVAGHRGSQYRRQGGKTPALTSSKPTIQKGGYVGEGADRKSSNWGRGERSNRRKEKEHDSRKKEKLPPVIDFCTGKLPYPFSKGEAWTQRPKIVYRTQEERDAYFGEKEGKRALLHRGRNQVHWAQQETRKLEVRTTSGTGRTAALNKSNFGRILRRKRNMYPIQMEKENRRAASAAGKTQPTIDEKREREGIAREERGNSKSSKATESVLPRSRGKEKALIEIQQKRRRKKG